MNGERTADIAIRLDARKIILSIRYIEFVADSPYIRLQARPATTQGSVWFFQDLPASWHPRVISPVIRTTIAGLQLLQPEHNLSISQYPLVSSPYIFRLLTV
jgi:hypothetical protein